ncbi:MAG: hypothetical protein OXT69_11440 [Candidatus Poribacteria bacterium]|nr:hypothetical protein [Candidatus Poribacteria bacterium]
MTPNERILVLELLKEGKISTEAAEKLLSALSRENDGGRGMNPRKRFEEAFQRVEREFRAIDLSDFEKKMNGFFEEMRRRFPDMQGKTKRGGASEKSESGGLYHVSKNASLNIAQKGGSIRLFGANGDQIRVDSPGASVETSQDGARIEIESIGGTLEIGIPNGLRRVYIDASGAQIEAVDAAPKEFTARSSGAGIRVKGVGGILRLSVVGGGIHIERPTSENIDAETNGGGVKARLGNRTQGVYKFRSAGGSVEMELGSDSEFELEYDVAGGMFESNWEAEAVGDNRLRVGQGGATLRASAIGGSVALLRADSANQQEGGGDA